MLAICARTAQRRQSPFAGRRADQRDSSPLVVRNVVDALKRAAEVVTILLVEQNLSVAHKLAHDAIVLDHGRVGYVGTVDELMSDPALARRHLGLAADGGRRTSREHRSLLLLLTGLGLGALYFLIASGLSLIWGLMRVLNFAHGALFTIAAYVAWSADRAAARRQMPLWAGSLDSSSPSSSAASRLCCSKCFLIRPLYARPIGQILVTVGVALAAGGADRRHFRQRTPSRWCCRAGCPHHRQSSASRFRTRVCS